MRMNRRHFLQTATASVVLNGVALRFAQAAKPDMFLSARTSFDGEHGFAGFTPNGAQVFDIPLPGRGHGSAVRPGTHEVVAFARRPGTFMTVIDAKAGRAIRQIDSVPGRHYYGHGVFSPDGATLYVAENAYEERTGVLGVYDAQNGYRRIGEIDSYGIGPHEVALLSDGQTLVVANGGILTHPDTDRVMLNIPTMQTSLAYIDRTTGALLESASPPPQWHQNSVRHMAITAQGQVVAGLQYQGAKKDRPPLIMLHRRGEEARFLTAPADVQKQMRNYCGSVCIDASGKTAAVSSPRGNLVTLWSLDTQAFVGSFTVPDVCGVAVDAATGGFLVTSGAGGGFDVHGRELTSIGGAFLSTRKWDNHLVAL